MAKPAHTRVVFEGVIGSAAAPLEHWAFGINFPAEAMNIAGDDTVDNLVAEDLANQWTTNWAGRLPEDCILTRVKVSAVNGAGHVALRADGSYAQGIWEGQHPGLNAKQGIPLQTALCFSLQTARSGSTGKGRFFMPWISEPINVDDKRIAAASAAVYAGVAKDFLNDLGTVMTYPPQVVSSKGYMSEVVSVRLGRVPDTLRSRRADLPEEYVTVPL